MEWSCTLARSPLIPCVRKWCAVLTHLSTFDFLFIVMLNIFGCLTTIMPITSVQRRETRKETEQHYSVTCIAFKHNIDAGPAAFPNGDISKPLHLGNFLTKQTHFTARLCCLISGFMHICEIKRHHNARTLQVVTP